MSGQQQLPWQVVAAAVIGTSHVAANQPCQDAVAWQQHDGWLFAAVCDGAGSAAHSHIGAQHMAEGVTSALTACVAALADADQAQASAVLQQVIGQQRQQLQALAKRDNTAINDYACTLVGAYINADGGWLFHIGDGVAVAEFADAPACISWPENGEYANETVFVSSEQWSKHLRLTRVPAAPTVLALMSDGAESFAMGKQRSGLFRPFIDPVLRYLQGVDHSTATQALAATLADPRTGHITSDDKTLLLAWPTAHAGGNTPA